MAKLAMQYSSFFTYWLVSHLVEFVAKNYFILLTFFCTAW
jgi:hypothetical protein